MSSESVCRVARSWVDVGSFHTRLVVRFMIFTASVRNILDNPRMSHSRIIRRFSQRCCDSRNATRCHWTLSYILRMTQHLRLEGPAEHEERREKF
jgi:hypothetical protein